MGRRGPLLAFAEIYALFRCIEDLFLRHPLPLTALVISPLPTLGTLAFPCQMIHSARAGHRISQFIIYESCSTIAAHIPIWGGRDTEWDHFFNRIAHGLIAVSRRGAKPPDSAFS